MRAIAFVTKLIDEGKINDCSLRRMHIHAIDADDVMQKLERQASSMLMAIFCSGCQVGYSAPISGCNLIWK